MVAIADNTLRIIATEKLGGVFNQVAAPLSYTPRRLVIHPESNMLLVIEADHNTMSDADIAKKKTEVCAFVDVLPRSPFFFFSFFPHFCASRCPCQLASHLRTEHGCLAFSVLRHINRMCELSIG